MSKLVVIQGTDCSGKGTQSTLLVEKLQALGIKAERFHFPNYDSPTGKIIGGPFLGREEICKCYFEDGLEDLDIRIPALYFAADFKYNMDIIRKKLEQGIVIVLDRYIDSSMAHQGGQEETYEKRLKMYKWIEYLDYEMLDLPRPDKTYLLNMPYEHALQLKKGRNEAQDELEKSEKHEINAGNAFLELATLFNYEIIDCVKNDTIRSINDINEELFNKVLEYLNK